ncbi:MAG TPA: SDR family NAD(P)-dependent oxidoreductase, partial [Pseudonocardiaceae bacterium]|nr:SDR family NAD(P)-dependent oxidoreductase [Pseudonocardiaceae bacterium]
MTRVAVVTGAGSGIGHAVAAALSADGWTVVSAGRHQDKLDVGTAHVTDVRDPASVTALFAFVEREYDQLNLLFNNAGVFGAGRPVDEVSEADWL